MHDHLERRLLDARNAGTKLADHLKTLPEIPSAYAVQDGEPTDARIQIKGEPARPGAVVPRGFPKVLGGQALSATVAESGSGRLELASWIASPDNPLTPRVIVNRVWQKHFGNGLVGSTSDFGLRGETPSHPELLDWLATDFVRHGWSLKHLHRRILNSKTYRQSSRDDVDQIAADPKNRFLWKFNRQRLDAESIRDTLLSVGGNLDPTPQSEPHPFPDKSSWKFTQHHPFKDSYKTQRRSVYRMQKRLTTDTYYQTFDGPDPNVCTSDRDESITSLQALYFVNDDFLHRQADSCVERLPESSSDVERLEKLFESVLIRPPTSEETRWMLDHVDQTRDMLAADSRVPDADRRAWASLVRSLFRLNEFLYLD